MDDSKQQAIIAANMTDNKLHKVVDITRRLNVPRSIRSVYLEYPFGQVDPNDVKLFHVVLLWFLTSLGQIGSIVNRQEGHPIHQLCDFIATDLTS